MSPDKPLRYSRWNFSGSTTVPPPPGCGLVSETTGVHGLNHWSPSFEGGQYMKRSLLLFCLVLLVVVLGTLTMQVRAQGGANSPEAQAARQKQLALEAETPKLQIKEERLPLTIPGHTLG